MITGDLIKHYTDDNSFGVVMKVDLTDVKVLWLDEDHPAVEYYPITELVVTSSADLDWENDVIMIKV
tara:strand:+ start:6399 stop:6599 length:201 start_codon:yes stop_codon:yes gene_type:complete